ncbi:MULTISPECIES: decarboxylase [unclassified Pseudomonas]|uniref:decarboxylase n=1 Tax=unclassified Pseudomonas TaxID=196821 RepID=UPI0021C5851A|nr:MULTISPECIES: decarboxylase [unclassified Pseudomonas]MCU1730469.1 decarboxylase [Pseudomonas sp. 20P_3.2_Bac4]MCU1744101.1 decarboxylase [Pseudomonas sp. 20P_3.2_Bac5]
MKPRTVGICLISRNRALQEDVQAVLDRLNHWLGHETSLYSQHWPDSNSQCLYRQVAGQAEAYVRLHAQGHDLYLDLRVFDSAADASLALATASSESDYVLFDTRHLHAQPDSDPLVELLDAQPEAKRSPSSALLLCDEEHLQHWLLRLGGNRLVRVPHPTQTLRRADLLRLFVDHLEHAYFNRLLARTTLQSGEPVALARDIQQRMDARWGDHWDCHFFTGSMVAGFLDSMGALLRGSGRGFHTASNEHALAVSALAGWQLYRRAYVIVMTSGMLDELRGTLANLKRAGAPGLVICADSPESVWFAFQGSLDRDNDGHQVIAARGLWQRFIRRPDESRASVESAFAALDAAPAPTFLFATQAVLESRVETGTEKPAPPQPAPASELDDTQRAALDSVLDVLNHEPSRILWQCGRLSEQERDRVMALARRSGVALADSIIAPGSVSAYQDQEPVLNYLGPLSMYGFSRRIHAFLEQPDADEGKPWLFFLKSKIDQSATPYSEGRLKRLFHIVQINRRREHISPFTEVALELPLATVLDYLEPRLNVPPPLLQARRERLQRLQRTREALPSDQVETLPMTPNFFFHRLGLLLGEMIERDGYRYTGVYDVGRCSISAMRNLPRTDAGFSGWYGRALMGDALMSLPYIALNNSRHVLAFIGDGARALVPDIEQRLAMCLASTADAAQRNVTVLYLSNGVLSMIQTYLDKRYACHGAAQVNVPLNGGPVWEEQPFGPISICRARLLAFCPDTLRQAITAPGRLNFFDVWLGHNSEGDGLSLVSETAWSRLNAESH